MKTPLPNETPLEDARFALECLEKGLRKQGQVDAADKVGSLILVPETLDVTLATLQTVPVPPDMESLKNTTHFLVDRVRNQPTLS